MRENNSSNLPGANGINKFRVSLEENTSGAIANESGEC